MFSTVVLSAGWDKFPLLSIKPYLKTFSNSPRKSEGYYERI